MDEQKPVLAPRMAFLDGLRGYFLIGMLAAHLSLATPGIFIPHHGHILHVWDAEGFVVIAGFLVSSIIVRRRSKEPGAKTGVLVRERLGKLYRFQMYAAIPLALIGLVAAIIAHFPQHDVSTKLLNLLFAFVALHGPEHTDVLQLYFFLFLLVPGFVFLLERFGVWATAAASLTLYGLGQLFYGDVLASLTIYRVPAQLSFPYFDVLAWQACFMFGFLLAWRLDRVKEVLEKWSKTRSVLLLALCCVCITLINFNAHALEAWWRDHAAIGFGLYDARQQFAPTYFGDTLLLMAIATILALAPLPAALFWVRGKLRAFFTLPAFIAVGRDSIRMYLVHVYLVWLFIFALKHHLAPHNTIALYGIILCIVVGFISVPWMLGRLDSFKNSRAWPLRISRPSY